MDGPLPFFSRNCTRKRFARLGNSFIRRGINCVVFSPSARHHTPAGRGSMKLENVLRCGVVFGSSCNALQLLLLVCTSEPLPGATFGTEREAKDDAPEGG